MVYRTPIRLMQTDSDAIACSATVIRNGGIIACPTDTVYGLAAYPFNQAAVERLFKIKHRDPSQPISLLIGDPAMLTPLVSKIPPIATILMHQYWPGPLTLVFEAAPGVPSWLIGGTGKIGLRLPDSKLVVALVQALQCPVTATSANRSGEAPCRSASDIEKAGLAVDYILEGGLCDAPPSTVLDVTTLPPRLLRQGGLFLPLEDI